MDIPISAGNDGDKKLYVIQVAKSHVLKKDISVIKECLPRLKKVKKEGQGCLAIVFDGYNDDTREIYEIQEIRDYCAKILDNIPELFYFLTEVDQNKHIILACLCDISVQAPMKKSLNPVIDKINGQKIANVQIHYSIPIFIKKRIELGVKKYGIKVGNTPIEIKRILQDIFSIYQKSPDEIKQEEMLKAYELSYESFSNKLWESRVKNELSSNIIFKQLSFEEASNVVNSLTVLNDNSKEGPICASVAKNINGIMLSYNLFRHFDTNPVCHCGGKDIIIYKKNLRANKQDYEHFYPTIDFYIKKKIVPTDNIFMTQPPIPIEKGEDKYFCLKCRKWYTIT